MEWHELFVAALAAIATTPIAFLYPTCVCCKVCGDNKPATDPASEGTWSPSGSWRDVAGVTWTFTANSGSDSGNTWFFYGSAATSKAGGGATLEERQDWGNICNWYSNKTTSPGAPFLLSSLNKRATRLPPENAVVHVYSDVSTVDAGPQVVKNIYFWRSSAHTGNTSSITTTDPAHDSEFGAVFTDNASNTDFAAINGGALFNLDAVNSFNGVVNGGAVFDDTASNQFDAIVNDGAVFNHSASNGETGTSAGSPGVVNDGAFFNDDATNLLDGVVNGGAVFNDNSANLAGVVNGGAVFNNSSVNSVDGIVNDGAVFNGNARNGSTGTVNGGATFNDNACSLRRIGNFFNVPCDRKFVAHPTDLPTCNGSAPNGCDNANDTCGCG